MATMVEVFNGAVVKKNIFVNFQRSEFVWSVSRESEKELICQKKMGVTRHLRELYLCNASTQPPTSCISHNMFDMLVFLMVLCAWTKKNCILVC